MSDRGREQSRDDQRERHRHHGRRPRPAEFDLHRQREDREGIEEGAPRHELKRRERPLRARRELRCGQCWWSAVQARRRRAIRRTTPAASCPTPRSTPEAKRVSPGWPRSEEHTSELQSLMRLSYAVFCLKKTQTHTT